jgi:flagellum-specific peptidoglycan hydrolase FlgJ
MTLPDTLPDVPAEDWFQHQAQQFQQQAQAQIDSLHSGAAMDAIHAAPPLQALPQLPTVQPPQIQLPQVQGPPNPIDAIFGGGAPAAPAPAAPPPIAPAPAAPAPAAPAPVAPTAAPPSAPPAPTAAPDQSWFGDALTHVANAGGDVQQFASDLGNRVDPSVTDPGQIYGHALTAAANSGADVSQFAQNFTPPPPPLPANLPGADQLSAIFDQPAASQVAARSSAGLGTGEITSAGAPAGGIDNSSRAAFARSFAPYAAYISQKTGIAPDLITAMSGSESNFGNAPGNELFGIKALPGQKSQSLATHEGEWGGTNMNQDFAAYDTPQESADAYINLITKHYPGAMGAQTAQDLAHGLKQGGYFTANEQEYANSLAGIQKQVSGPVSEALGGGAGDAPGQGYTVPTTVGEAQRQDFGRPVAVEEQRQFENEAGLSAGDAYSACGPVAAAAFAKTYGRNPTPVEAMDLARQVGWTGSAGMAGPASEQALLNRMGVSTHLTQGVDWDQVKQDAQSGNPVIISMAGHGAGHYAYIDGYDPNTGAFHGGASTGASLKGGQEWVTPQDLSRMGWTPQVALFADNPATPHPSPAASNAPPNATFTSSTISNKAQQVEQAVQDVGTQATTGAQNLFDQLNPNKPPAPNQPPPGTPLAPQAPQQPGFTQGSQPPTTPGLADSTSASPPPQPPTNPLDQFKQQIGDAFANLLGPVVGGTQQAGGALASSGAGQAAQAAVNQLSQPPVRTGTPAPPDYTVPTTTAEAQRQQTLQQQAAGPTNAPSGDDEATFAALHPDQALTDDHVSALQSIGAGASALGATVSNPAQAYQRLSDTVDQALASIPPDRQSTDWQNIKAQADTISAQNPAQAVPIIGSVISDLATSGQLAPQSAVALFHDFQAAEKARQDVIAQNNPVRDEPILGGLTTMGAQMATDPLTYLPGIGEGAGALTSGIGSDVLRGLAKSALEGGLYGGIQGAEDPAATLQDYLLNVGAGAGLNVAGHVAAPLALRGGRALLGGASDLGSRVLSELGDRLGGMGLGEPETAYASQGMSNLTPQVAQDFLDYAKHLGAQTPPPAEDIARAGVAIRDPGYAAGSPEQAAEDLFNRNSAAQGNATRPAVTAQDLQQLPGLAGATRNVDDLRAAVDAGRPFSDWYGHFANWMKGMVGEDNTPEALSIFAHTSPRNPVPTNAAAVISLMRAARQTGRDGNWDLEAVRDFSNAYRDPVSGEINQIQNFGRDGVANNPTMKAIWDIVSGQDKAQASRENIGKLMQGYLDGTVQQTTNAKTSSYYENLINALAGVYDPWSTNDTWMGQLFGPLGSFKADNPDWYRSTYGVVNRVAREFGMAPRDAQAAAWTSFRSLMEPKVAKPANIAAIADQVRNGNMSIADGIRAADQAGFYRDMVNSGTEWSQANDLPSALQEVYQNPKFQQTLANLHASGIDLKSPPPEGAISDVRVEHAGRTRGGVAGRTVSRTAGTGATEIASAAGPNIPISGMGGLGYDAARGRLDILGSIPHEVVPFGDGATVRLPGGNADTARTVAATIGNTLREPSMTIHYPDSSVPTRAGLALEKADGSAYTADELTQLGQTMAEHGLVAHPSSDGTTIQIPHTDGSARSFLDGVFNAASDSDISNKIGAYRGDYETIARADYGRFAQGVRDQGLAAGPSYLQARPGRRAPQGVGAAAQRALSDFSGSQSGSADPRLALRLGAGVGSGLLTYSQTDPNDPMRWPKVAAATLGGAAAPDILGRGLVRAGFGGVAHDVEAGAAAIAREAADRGVDLSKPAETTPAVETAAAKILDHVDQRAPGLGQNYADTAPTHKDAVAQLSSDLSRFSKTTSETPKFTADGKPNNLAANDVESAGKARANQTRLANGDTVRVRSVDTLGKLDNATVISPNPNGRGVYVMTDAGERRYVATDDVYPSAQTARRLAGTPTAPTPPPVTGQQPINMTDAEQLARLRLQQFPEHLRQTIGDAAQDVGWANANRRGVMPDAVVANQAKLIAADKSFTQMLMDRPPGSALNAEQMLAMQNAVGGTGARVYDLAAKINGGDRSDATMANFLHEGDRLRQLVAVAEGGRAEMGRGLRVFQQKPQLIDLAPEQALAEMTNTLGGRENLLKAAQDYEMLQRAQTSPAQLAAFWGGLQKGPPRGIKGVGEWITALRYSSMISGLPTAERVGVGGAINAVYGLARDGGVSLVGDTIHAAKGDIPLTSIGHSGSAMFKGAVLGMIDGFHGFGQIMRHGISDWRAGQGELPVDIASRLGRENAAVRGAGYSLSFFGRTHQGLNELAQRTAFNMRLYQRAAELAQSKGYFGKTEGEFIDNFVKNPSAPGYQAAFHDAMEYGRVAANRGELGNLGQFMQGVRHIPVAGQFILPFARVAYGIGSRMVDLTPLGAAGTAFDIARTGGRYARATSVEDVEGLKTMTGGRLSGVRPIQQRLADNLIGSAIFGASMYEALNSSENADGSWSPNLTGAGPDSPAARAQLESTGWQPYSLKVGGHYVPMRMLGAFMGPMGIAADMAEAYRYAKPKAGEDAPSAGDIAGNAVHRLGRFATNETYLQSIADSLNAVQDPTRYGSTWATNQASSFVPFGAAGRSVEQVTDPYQRATNLGNPLMQAGERAASNIPGLAGTLPTRNDVLGRPMRNQFGAGWLPANISAGQHDPTLDALDAAGVTVPRVDPVATSRNGVTGVKLTEAEQRQVEREQGQLIQQYVGTMLENPNFQSYSADQRAQLLQHAVSAARSQSQNQAVGRALQQDPNRRLPAHRIMPTVITTPRVPLPTPSR